MNDPYSSIPLYKRLFIDGSTGVCAGFVLGFFITPVDVSVFEYMSQRVKTIGESMKRSLTEMVTKPHRYITNKEFIVVMGTYGGTYTAKNLIDTYSMYNHQTAEQNAFYKFWCVFLVNGGLSTFWKDPAMISKFGAAQNKSFTPLVYFWWVMRDVIHTFVSAVVPDLIERKFSLTKSQWTYIQLAAPLLVQWITTPCHLLAMDYYNFEGKQLFKDRVSRVMSKTVSSTLIRMARMFAPWSIGMVINRDLRDQLLEKQLKQ